MMQSQTRMTHKHSGSRVPHDFLHFLLHVWAVAVDEAFAAGAFLLLKRTLVQTHTRILHELGAFCAEFAVGSVVSFAVDVHHGFDGFLLTRYSGMFSGHFKIPFQLLLQKQACCAQIRLHPKPIGIPNRKGKSTTLFVTLSKSWKPAFILDPISNSMQKRGEGVD